VVTGAQCFDLWFDRQPTLDRDAFCAKVGLDATRPFVTYVCSALFRGSPSEAEFVRKWIAAMRASGHPSLRDAGVLVRPHPKRAFEWNTVDLAGIENVTLWPPRAAAPNNDETKADYFDSLFHAAAVVGINTSAQIEAGIIGRPVHTFLLPEFLENQEGTLHFHYLLDGGLLRTARDLPVHFEQLAASLDSPADVHHNRAFIESFVRPHGMAHAATPAFVDAVEAMATVRGVPHPERLWLRGIRGLLAPVARRTSGTFAEKAARERRFLEKDRERVARHEQLQAQRAAEKAELLRQREQRKAAARRAKEEQAARLRAEQAAAKRRARDEKARAKAARSERRRREKQRQAWNARVAGLWRRISGRESTAR
jgi:hypothetical protein